MAGIFRAYIAHLNRRPLLVQSVSSAIIAGGGDALSQCVIERRTFEEYDFARTGRFFVLSGFFIAPILNRWFVVLERINCANKRLVPFKRLAVDQSTFSPIFNAVVLFNLRILEGFSSRDSFDMMKHDWWPVWSSSLMYWPCVQAVNFSLVPLNQRVVVTQVAGLFWNCYLSWKTQKKLPTGSPDIADHAYRIE